MIITQKRDGLDDYLSVPNFCQSSWWSFVFSNVYLSFCIISYIMMLFVLHAGENCRALNKVAVLLGGGEGGAGFTSHLHPAPEQLTAVLIELTNQPSKQPSIFIVIFNPVRFLCQRSFSFVRVLSWLECKIDFMLWEGVYTHGESVNLNSDLHYVITL